MARDAGLPVGVVILTSLGLLACSPRATSPAPPPEPHPVVAPSPPVSPSPTPAPAPSLQLPTYRHPEGAIALPCHVVADLDAVIEEGGQAVRLGFSLVNRSNADRSVTLRGHCPQGFVTVHGLPQGFDPLHTCRAGACIEPEMTTVVTVPARGRIPLGETLLRAGGDACNPPWPMDSRPLWISVQGHLGDSFVCPGAAVEIEREPSSSTLRLVTHEPRPAPPPPPPPTSPPRPTVPVEPQPTRERVCPTCGIGCPDSRPLTGVGPDGCPLCGCEKRGPSFR